MKDLANNADKIRNPDGKSKLDPYLLSHPGRNSK
jgi:hypothetical protein